MISVVLADDQPLIRSALADLLRSEPDISIIGEAGDGAAAVHLTRTLRPDIVLMDIRMPKMDGIEATRAICEDHQLAATRVLVLTTFEQDDYIFAALRAGASGFLGKGLDPNSLADAVRTVHDGESLLSPAATRSVIDRVTAAPDPREVRPSHPGIATLTSREREVLTLVAAGRSNDGIARELSISSSTAKTHVNRVMSKVWAHDRAQLVIIAYENGLITAGDPPVLGT
jgi:DNA-binding NarL/FixJ family response regulator